MKKNQTRGMIILAVIAVVYAVVVCLIPFAKTAVFWLSFLFTLLSLLAAGYAAKIAFAQEDARSKFYGFPIAKIGAVYFIVQLMVGLVFMCFSKWAPVWLAAVVDIVLLGAACVGFIAADATREEVERQDTKLQKNVSTMRALQSRANALAHRSEDQTLSSALQKFAENLRFSDPVSNASLQDVEGELSQCVTELECAVVDADNASAQTLCRKAESLLAERNRLCRLGK